MADSNHNRDGEHEACTLCGAVHERKITAIFRTACGATQEKTFMEEWPVPPRTYRFPLRRQWFFSGLTEQPHPMVMAVRDFALVNWDPVMRLAAYEEIVR